MAAKSDRASVPQRYPVQPDEYCRRLKLSAPLSVSLKAAVTADVYSQIARVCTEPYGRSKVKVRLV